MAKVSKDGTSVEFNEVRGMLRKEIEKRYGSIPKFLNSEKGEEFGGAKIKVYLYDAGPVSFHIISRLCDYFGIGKLTRKIKVVRSVSYRLSTNDTVTEKTS